MKGYALASAIVAALSLFSTVAADVDPIVIKVRAIIHEEAVSKTHNYL